LYAYLISPFTIPPQVQELRARVCVSHVYVTFDSHREMFQCSLQKRGELGLS